jgi:hypothetical protein
MKYENREVANNICDQIKELKAKLDDLNPPDYIPITVEIWVKKTSIKMGIRDEDFGPFLAVMIDSLKQNITERIENLKSQLELL